MFKRTRYQEGSLMKEKRHRGDDVWVYRWREAAPDGSVKRKKIILGTVKELTSEAHARKHLASLQLNVNENASQGAHPALMTMRQLICHYMEKELGEERPNKAQSTVEVYTEYLDNRILPRWGNVRVLDVKPVEVEAWLRSMKRQDGANLAQGTKAKTRNIMSAVFEHARRYQFIATNPIRGLVRQGAKRGREPDVLTAAEIASIITGLSSMHRILVILAATTGLRFSELRGLRWQDIDIESRLLHLRRGVVRKHITELKTQAARKPMPLDPLLLQLLNQFRHESPYCGLEDWVFASTRKRGKVPIWPSSLMSDYVLPAARAAGITKRVTWHVFRHSYATLLKGNGEDVKTVQESLRHASPELTMAVYVQAIPSAVRTAHERIVGQIAGEEAGRLPGPVMDPISDSVSAIC